MVMSNNGYTSNNCIILEGRCLEVESGTFIDAEHDVHVLYSLTDCTFEKVVNHAGNNDFLAKDFYVYESLVCVHHLLEVESLVAVVGKSSVFIEVLVE